MKWKFIVITSITFALFFLEAILHYNLGKTSEVPIAYNIAGKTIYLPNWGEVLHIAVFVLIFASITGFLTAYIIHHHLDE